MASTQRRFSSGYHCASGHLDHQAFYKAIHIDQAYLADMVLGRILKAWIDWAVLARTNHVAFVCFRRTSLTNFGNSSRAFFDIRTSFS